MFEALQILVSKAHMMMIYLGKILKLLTKSNVSLQVFKYICRIIFFVSSDLKTLPLH